MTLASPAYATTSYPTTLTEAAPAAITYGASTNVSGRLVLRGTPFGLSGEKVSLYSRPLGTTAWTYVTAHTTNTRGYVYFSVAPRKAWQYLLQHPTDQYTTASQSAAVTVRIRYRVSGALSKNPVVAGTTESITATVAPNASGASVVFQRKTTSGWTTLATKTLSSTSKAVYSFRAPANGKYAYRIVKAGTTAYLQGISPTLVLTVG